MKKLRIGIDVGRTIADSEKVRIAGLTTDNVGKEGPPPFECSRSVIQYFCSEYYRNNIFIVSKCTEEIEDVILVWLHYHGFIALRYLIEGNVKFCRERLDKVPIARDLGLDVFIDDRPEILLAMNSVDHKILFKPSRQVKEKYGKDLNYSGIKICNTWIEVETSVSNYAKSAI